MAKVTVAGQAVVITSGVKLEDIKTIAKYRPDALVLKGGKDDKEEIFRVGVTEGNGSINQFGASFGQETRDANKLAIITTETDYKGADIVEHVADEYGAALTNLNKLEATIPGVLEAIKAERDTIKGAITVAQ